MDAGVAVGADRIQGESLRSALIGTWRLLSWEAVRAEGGVQRPFGAGPLGYLVYTDAGRMLTTISRAGRASIGGDLLTGPEAGRAVAFASFVAYSGTFSVVGEHVLHHVEMSLFPDWVGTTQRRRVEIDALARLLVLRPEVIPGSGAVEHVLRWERVQA